MIFNHSDWPTGKAQPIKMACFVTQLWTNQIAKICFKMKQNFKEHTEIDKLPEQFKGNNNKIVS